MKESFKINASENNLEDSLTLEYAGDGKVKLILYKQYSWDSYRQEIVVPGDKLVKMLKKMLEIDSDRMDEVIKVFRDIR